MELWTPPICCGRRRVQTITLVLRLWSGLCYPGTYMNKQLSTSSYSRRLHHPGSLWNPNTSHLYILSLSQRKTALPKFLENKKLSNEYTFYLISNQMNINSSRNKIPFCTYQCVNQMQCWWRIWGYSAEYSINWPNFKRQGNCDSRAINHVQSLLKNNLIAGECMLIY